MSDPPSPKTESLRIIDANANRASEGLRVVEEYVRFVLDDQHLTQLCKQLRHDLATTLATFSATDLCATRDTSGDVGTNVTTDGEYIRQDARDVALASQKRVEQSLRCIEEYSKTFASDAASSIEQLRYRAYSLGKTIVTTTANVERLAGTRLYVLIDGGELAEEFAELASQLVAAGVHVLQLRDKNLDDRTLISRARQLRQITRDAETLCVINDRPDIAVLCDADGVHVGQEELSVKDARTIVGPGKLVGMSTHSIEQARQAVLDGADYIGCGPTFPSGTKQFDAFPGIAFLEQVASEISLPAFAIGGINLENIAEVIDAGFTRVAVSGSVVASREPIRAAEAFLAALAFDR